MKLVCFCWGVRNDRQKRCDGRFDRQTQWSELTQIPGGDAGRFGYVEQEGNIQMTCLREQ